MKALVPLLFFSSFALAGSAWAGEAKSLEIGAPAPMFMLKAMNADRAQMKSLALRNYVGNSPKFKKKAIVLSFAASYCEPCKRELAELKKLEAKLNAAEILLAVVVIDTDAEGIEKMRKLTMDELDLPFPILSDRFGVLARRYHANSLPMTVVVNPDGKVRWLNVGFQEDAIDKLLGALALKK